MAGDPSMTASHVRALMSGEHGDVLREAARLSSVTMNAATEVIASVHRALGVIRSPTAIESAGALTASR
jgi:hypothetical protein